MKVGILFIIVLTVFVVIIMSILPEKTSKWNRLKTEHVVNLANNLQQIDKFLIDYAKSNGNNLYRDRVNNAIIKTRGLFEGLMNKKIIDRWHNLQNERLEYVVALSEKGRLTRQIVNVNKDINKIYMKLNENMEEKIEELSDLFEILFKDIANGQKNSTIIEENNYLTLLNDVYGNVAVAIYEL